MDKFYLKGQFIKSFGQEPSAYFSAPGRTELIGNHTDHQHGRILSSAIKQSANAAVARTSDGIITIMSEGFEAFTVDTKDLAMRSSELGTPISLVRGVAAGFGSEVPGFKAYIYSDVPAGKGLSSSAAFEVLIARIINGLGLFNKTAVELAMIGMRAENEYYGKPCGLQDQTVSAVGKTVIVDFKDPSEPVIEELPFDPKRHGYALCIIDSNASHDDMTADFSSIIDDMRIISEHFGVGHLRHVDESNLKLVNEMNSSNWHEALVPLVEFKDRSELIARYGQRAVDRSEHSINESMRVAAAAQALREDRFEDFLRLVNMSGRSSENYLKNIVSETHPEITDVRDTLDLLKELLNGRGAYRVHGGGFAGTTQAYVPLEMLDEFSEKIKEKLGESSLIIL